MCRRHNDALYQLILPFSIYTVYLLCSYSWRKVMLPLKLSLSLTHRSRNTSRMTFSHTWPAVASVQSGETRRESARNCRGARSDPVSDSERTVIPMLIPSLPILAARGSYVMASTTFSIATLSFYIQQVLRSSIAAQWQSIKVNRKTLQRDYGGFIWCKGSQRNSSVDGFTDPDVCPKYGWVDVTPSNEWKVI